MNELYAWWRDVYLPFEARDSCLVEVECPKLVTRKSKSMPGTRRVSFQYSSPEAEARARTALLQRRETEERMERQLTERCKQVIELRRFMWT